MCIRDRVAPWSEVVAVPDATSNDARVRQPEDPQQARTEYTLFTRARTKVQYRRWTTSPRFEGTGGSPSATGDEADERLRRGGLVSSVQYQRRVPAAWDGREEDNA